MRLTHVLTHLHLMLIFQLCRLMTEKCPVTNRRNVSPGNAFFRIKETFQSKRIQTASARVSDTRNELVD